MSVGVCHTAIERTGKIKRNSLGFKWIVLDTACIKSSVSSKALLFCYMSNTEEELFCKLLTLNDLTVCCKYFIFDIKLILCVTIGIFPCLSLNQYKMSSNIFYIVEVYAWLSSSLDLKWKLLVLVLMSLLPKFLNKINFIFHILIIWKAFLEPY